MTTLAIVLVRMQESFEPSKTQMVKFDGYNSKPAIERTMKPVTLLWTIRPRKADMEKAQAFARQEGYIVVEVPRGRNMFEDAKREYLKKVGTA